VNFVLDLDIRSFFDKVGHDHMEKFVRHRIGDERIVRLILKWIKAGVMEDGQWFETKEGTPQGAVTQQPAPTCKAAPPTRRIAPACGRLPLPQ
jgi:retron-type reverse transcriptase